MNEKKEETALKLEAFFQSKEIFIRSFRKYDREIEHKDLISAPINKNVKKIARLVANAKAYRAEIGYDDSKDYEKSIYANRQRLEQFSKDNSALEKDLEVLANKNRLSEKEERDFFYLNFYSTRADVRREFARTNDFILKERLKISQSLEADKIENKSDSDTIRLDKEHFLLGRKLVVTQKNIAKTKEKVVKEYELSQEFLDDPKRAASAYFLFAQAEQPLVQAQFPQQNVTELSLKMQKKWNSLDLLEKEKYQKMAQEFFEFYRLSEPLDLNDTKLAKKLAEESTTLDAWQKILMQKLDFDVDRGVFVKKLEQYQNEVEDLIIAVKKDRKKDTEKYYAKVEALAVLLDKNIELQNLFWLQEDLLWYLQEKAGIKVYIVPEEAYIYETKNQEARRKAEEEAGFFITPKARKAVKEIAKIEAKQGQSGCNTKAVEKITSVPYLVMLKNTIDDRIETLKDEEEGTTKRKVPSVPNKNVPQRVTASEPTIKHTVVPSLQSTAEKNVALLTPRKKVLLNAKSSTIPANVSEKRELNAKKIPPAIVPQPIPNLPHEIQKDVKEKGETKWQREEKLTIIYGIKNKKGFDEMQKDLQAGGFSRSLSEIITFYDKFKNQIAEYIVKTELEKSEKSLKRIREQRVGGVRTNEKSKNLSRELAKSGKGVKTAAIEPELDSPIIIGKPGKVEIKASNLPAAGRGVFAVKDIRKNTKIDTYDGEVLNKKQFEQRYPDEETATHVIALSKNKFIDAVNLDPKKAKGFGGFYNDPNFKKRKRDESLYNVYAIQWPQEGVPTTIAIITRRKIKKGEELYLDYQYE